MPRYRTDDVCPKQAARRQAGRSDAGDRGVTIVDGYGAPALAPPISGAREQNYTGRDDGCNYTRRREDGCAGAKHACQTGLIDGQECTDPGLIDLHAHINSKRSATDYIYKLIFGYGL